MELLGKLVPRTYFNSVITYFAKPQFNEAIRLKVLQTALVWTRP